MMQKGHFALATLVEMGSKYMTRYSSDTFETRRVIYFWVSRRKFENPPAFSEVSDKCLKLRQVSEKPIITEYA